MSSHKQTPPTSDIRSGENSERNPNFAKMDSNFGSTAAVVSMTEPQTEANINGLTSNLNQLALSTKTVIFALFFINITIKFHISYNFLLKLLHG